MKFGVTLSTQDSQTKVGGVLGGLWWDALSRLQRDTTVKDPILRQTIAAEWMTV